MWLLASVESWIMLLVGIALLVSILLRRSWRYQRRAASSGPAFGDRASRPATSPVSDTPDALLQWQVEMHATARDLKAELDSKIGVLQTLVAMARQESQRLEHAVTRAQRLGVSSCPDTLQAIEDRQPESLPELPAHGAPQALDEHRQQVLALADQGLPAASIARQLGVPLGDVEMLLSLHVPTPPE